jgi:aryl-phospho-beta-D-glucosidase BglC (GH1 family)
VRTARLRTVAAAVACLGVGGLLVACGQSAAVQRPSSTAATSQTSTSTAADPGFYRTSGVHIVDAAGATVQLTGLNVQGMETTNPQGSNVPGVCNNAWRPLTASEVDQIAAYGFKTVRLPVAWGNLEPTVPTLVHGGLVHHWNTSYVDALDTEIQLLGTAGIHVILDMHQSSWSAAFSTPATAKRPACPGSGMPVWLNPGAADETPQQAACAFYAGSTEPGVPGSAWSDFADAESYLDSLFVGNQAVVGQDVVNEPNCGNGRANLDGFYALLAPAVEKANAHLLIILEDKDDPGTFELTRLPDVPNVVLSIHLHEDYWTTPGADQQTLPYSGQDALAANVQRARTWDVPLYVGEFYAFDGTGSQGSQRQPDPNWFADTKAFVASSSEQGVSWSFWSWTQKADPAVQPELTPDALAALGSV